jgi:arylsulfatase A-like enzyme
MPPASATRTSPTNGSKNPSQWIEANKDKPFFLFFASHDIHVPRIPHERFQGRHPSASAADSIVQLDWCVGELMKTLDRLGLAENTLVIFCSDNGPVMDDGYAGLRAGKTRRPPRRRPLRGGKYSVYEGGTRTPFITRWKGRIPAGVSEEIVCTIDLAASFAALTGLPLPDDAFLDSFDVSAALLGNPAPKAASTSSSRTTAKAAISASALAIGNSSATTRNPPQPRGRTQARQHPVPRFQLFDLATDPAEKPT